MAVKVWRWRGGPEGFTPFLSSGSKKIYYCLAMRFRKMGDTRARGKPFIALLNTIDDFVEQLMVL